VSKIGKIFGFLANPLGIGKKKAKTIFIPPSSKAVAKQTSADEVAQRRIETAARLRSGRVTALAKEEEEEDAIKRAGARKAKLLGS